MLRIFSFNSIPQTHLSLNILLISYFLWNLVNWTRFVYIDTHSKMPFRCLYVSHMNMKMVFFFFVQMKMSSNPLNLIIEHVYITKKSICPIWVAAENDHNKPF